MSADKGSWNILITGASGFIGTHLVQHLSTNHKIFALARRTQNEVGLRSHPNVDWILVDLTDRDKLSRVFKQVTAQVKLDYVIHLAAYYDFGDQIPGEIYEKTNVEATRLLLDLSRHCELKHFIFASSAVICEFPVPGDLISEQGEANASFPYALSKRAAEALVCAASEHFPCSIVRLAAVCSDWCEYEPLYHFLKTWLSDRWDARILPGRGAMAIPYIHIGCVVELLNRILERSPQLAQINHFLASSDESTSLLELFTLATRHFYGEARTAVFIPPWMARFGVLARDLWGRVIGKRPFERVWMTDYIDRTFATDSSFTRDVLDWYPKDRHRITRRLLHLIENMKSRPDEWHARNMGRLGRFEHQRPALTLAEEMMRTHEALVQVIFDQICSPLNSHRFPTYQSRSAQELRWEINVVYNHLLTSVRHGDRSIMIVFGHDLARRGVEEGVSLAEICEGLLLMNTLITEALYQNESLVELKLLVHDYITLAIQLAIDEIKDVYENMPL